jgi:hypothetical protein
MLKKCSVAQMQHRARKEEKSIAAGPAPLARAMGQPEGAGSGSSSSKRRDGPADAHCSGFVYRVNALRYYDKRSF